MSKEIIYVHQSGLSRAGESITGMDGTKTYGVKDTDTGEIQESKAYNLTQLGENIRDGATHDPD
jgi:hypothetical protein